MRSQSLFCLAAAGLAAMLMPAAGAAQQPAANEKPAFHTRAPKTQVVVLPVLVLDKHGKPVNGLTAADFALTQDGRTQTIGSFSQQSELPFQIGLLMDTSEPLEPAIDTVRHAAEKFVEQMLPADPKQAKTADELFLLHFDNEVELLRDFTNSREKLQTELEQMGPTSAEHNNPQGPETVDSGDVRPSHGGTQLYDAIYLASNDLMKPKTGRKALIVFSDGVDRSSKETQSDAIDAAEHAGTIVDTIYFRGGVDKSQGFPGRDRRGGSGYPGGGNPGGYPGGRYPGGGYPGGGYPGGGYPGGGSPGGGRPQKAPIDGKKVMQDIANRTGGQFFEAKHSADLAEIYNIVAQNLRGQYVLTYTPDQTDDEGGYHKVVVKPNNKDLRVITRMGYYAPGGNSD
jgi:VWFA-related protein